MDFHKNNESTWSFYKKLIRYENLVDKQKQIEIKSFYKNHRRSKIIDTLC